ncbi:hypothetical protein, partial [Caldanaerobacter subterraneus]|uniref:hypothetical protein n=1 Tax=Caldanaerobacter subterraneus TaxID=911092 RepID=UPI001B809B34
NLGTSPLTLWENRNLKETPIQKKKRGDPPQMPLVGIWAKKKFWPPKNYKKWWGEKKIFILPLDLFPPRGTKTKL